MSIILLSCNNGRSGFKAGLLRRLCRNLTNDRPRFIHRREALMQSRNIKETLAHAKKVDVALVGIGSTSSELYSLLRAGYVNEAEAQQIRTNGAVGDICAQHYSISGQWLDIELNRRAVGVGLEDLVRIETVIGVAGSSRKGAAILGALRGGYVNALITDDHAAQKVLALHQSTPGYPKHPAPYEYYLGVFQMTCKAGFPACRNGQTKSPPYFSKSQMKHILFEKAFNDPGA